MPNIFQPPLVDTVPRNYAEPNDPVMPVTKPAKDLFRYVRRGPVGATVLKHADGSYTTLSYPTTDQMKAAAQVYEGGHVYSVTDEEAANLRAAGFHVETT